MKILLSTTTNVINLIACCTKQINLTFRPPSVWPLFDFLLVSGITCRNKGQRDIVRYSLYVPQKSNNDLYSWDASEFFVSSELQVQWFRNKCMNTLKEIDSKWLDSLFSKRNHLYTCQFLLHSDYDLAGYNEHFCP